MKDELSSKLLKLIEENSVPWRSEWDNEFETRPFNPITGTIYRGLNFFRLFLSFFGKEGKEGKEVTDWRFSTFNQLKKANIKLKKGCHGYHVFYLGSYLKENEENEEEREERKYLKSFTVFNYEDVEIPEDSPLPKIETKKFECDNNYIMSIINKLNINVIEGNCLDPCYRIDKNIIETSNKFWSDSSRYATLFHEIVHWTAKNIPSCKRNCEYALEELIAEFGAFMICRELNIHYKPSEVLNYYGYLNSWLNKYKTEDEKISAIESALKYANRAVKAILNAKD